MTPNDRYNKSLRVLFQASSLLTAPSTLQCLAYLSTYTYIVYRYFVFTHSTDVVMLCKFVELTLCELFTKYTN